MTMTARSWVWNFVLIGGGILIAELLLPHFSISYLFF